MVECLEVQLHFIDDNLALLLFAEQMEVASGMSFQGNEISHADVTILEGHTSEVYSSLLSRVFVVRDVWTSTLCTLINVLVYGTKIKWIL